MSRAESIRITAPAPELDVLFCSDPDVDGLAGWIMGLPMANTPETAAQVRQACYELARLRVTPTERLDLLEQIRPIIYYLCARLDRGAGNGGTHGDANARLAQRLQANLCTGYKAVVRDQLERMASTEHADDTLSLAVHRALSDLSRILLRTLQFYVAPAEQLWLELNQLYLLSERLGFTDAVMEDPENHHVPAAHLTALYLRSLLLAAAKPNQLRPSQLGELFTSLELWADTARVVPGDSGALFRVDLEADSGPLYSGLLTSAREPRGIDTRRLVDQLERHLRKSTTDITVPESMSPDLIHHLAAAWGSQQPRSHRRTPTAVPMKLCIGLRAVHHFLSGGVEFAGQSAGPETSAAGAHNPFLVEPAEREQPIPQQPPRDVWDDAFDVGGRIPENPSIPDPDRLLVSGPASKPPDRHARPAPHPNCRFHDATAVDTSPGGYRLHWNDPLPAHLQTGEVAALRETDDEPWNVGVIRWIRQDGSGTAMGIELLSPRAVPVVLRLLNARTRHTSHVLALMLPELRPIGQPATFITPPSPFQPGQKVHVQRQEAQRSVRLLQRTRRTDSFNQFTFQLLAGYLESTEPALKMAGQ